MIMILYIFIYTLQLNRNGKEGDPKSAATHLSSPAVILSHLQSMHMFGSKLFVSLGEFGTRLEALERGGVSNTTSQKSKELLLLQKDVDGRFSKLGKQVEQVNRHQAQEQKSSKISEKNLVVVVDGLKVKVHQLEEKNGHQAAEIRTIQVELQRKNHKSPWVGGTSPEYSSSEASRIDSLEKRYEDIERQVTMLKVHVSEMELQLQASLASTYNGSFMWRIPDMRKRKRDAIDGRISSLYSPPFYTAKNGYKMCIRVYLNGDGMGHKTHLSLFFVLMKGEFDALLKWPFDYKVSLILVDQNHRKHIVQTFKPTPESSSFQRPVSDMNVASGCPQFCKLSYLDDENYTKDDVLFIKVIVDTSSIFHP